ncbi:hypothetical protein BB561_006899 [Smittium simulii]|uniref:Uncharacterized protein n=1 Tax=Smittium simulii TaxID=133385 RepID=A0A2T9Y089_9FUNG|nr:hypothetical protein BB561_006899 [Smittium simulii]
MVPRPTETIGTTVADIRGYVQWPNNNINYKSQLTNQGLLYPIDKPHTTSITVVPKSRKYLLLNNNK